MYFTHHKETTNKKRITGGERRSTRRPPPEDPRPAGPAPVGAPLVTFLHALEEAAGEEGHGHEQDDGTAHDGGDDGHLEAEGLVGWHSWRGDNHQLLVQLSQTLGAPGGALEVDRAWLALGEPRSWGGSEALTLE